MKATVRRLETQIDQLPDRIVDAHADSVGPAWEKRLADPCEPEVSQSWQIKA